MTRLQAPNVVIFPKLIERIADKDALTVLALMFMKHGRKPFRMDRFDSVFMERLDDAMTRLCDLGCLKRIGNDRDRFRVISPEIGTLEEMVAADTAISPTWGTA
jgi:hypothetical protein